MNLFTKQKQTHRKEKKKKNLGFTGGSVVKNPLPIQETRVWSLAWEEPTCHGATSATTSEPVLQSPEPSYWARALQLLKPMNLRAHTSQQEKPPQWEARAAPPENSSCLLQLYKKPAGQWRFSIATNR